ncbi:MAG: hypothetical protein ACHQ52_10195 [Candidatus Eisenbacteria bacterium]
MADPARSPLAGLRTAAGAALALALALALGLVPGCGGKSSPMAPGVTPPYLGLVANLAPTESPGDYITMLGTVRGSGVDLQYASLQWDSFSPSSGVVDTSSLRALVDGLEAAFGFAVYINLATIDTNNDRRPADVRGLPWDDARVVGRLDSTVDALVAVLARPPRRSLVALALGNEVDAYLAANPGERPAYERLLVHEYARIHAAMPGVPLGVSTISPMNSPNAVIGDSLHALGDLVIYTYYPFQNGMDFVHKPTTTLDPDFDTMAMRAGAKRWALQEVGYSSSPVNGSSPALQADFVTRFRGRVARESRDHLLFATWFLYSDFSSTLVNQLTVYYGGSSPGFVAYLGNLGLRDTLAVDKPAWTAWTQAP